MARKIICPNCKKSFELSSDNYSDILQQVRNSEFKREVESHVQNATEKLSAEYKLKLSNVKSDSQQEIVKLEAEHKLKLANVKTELQREVTRLENELERIEDKLNLKAEKALTALQLELKSNQENYRQQLKAKDELIDFYKDFKAKLSTKGIGESLEQYCLNEFNKIRSIAFPNASFEKDNEVVNGSKGDFIFREYSNGDEEEEDNELVSIMFEMKNEADDTETKHKNKKFFKKLDKDRRNKNCEYAILVSTLESDSDYYNAGIVDVSHLYSKMYVIRPQFFIPVIGFLRNAALNSLQVKQELARIQAENIDVSNFEEKLREFKDAFSRNYRLASEKFGTAIEQLDKTIAQLTKVRELLVGSDRQLSLASAKADNITVAKLVRDNPTMKAKFKKSNSKSKKK